MSPRSTDSRYSFLRFTLCADTETLLRDGTPVKLRPQSFAVLKYLLEHRNQLVTKEELHDSIWGNTVVTDNSLRQCLIEVRKAIGDRSKRMIRTVPRRGFIVDMPVSVHGADTSDADASAGTPVRDHQIADGAASIRLPGRWWPAIVGAVSLVAVVLVMNGRATPPPVAVPPVPPSVAPGRLELRPLAIANTIDDADAIVALAASTFAIALSDYGITSVQADSGDFSRETPELVLKNSLFADPSGLHVDVSLSDSVTGTSIWTDRYEGDDVADVLEQSASQTAYIIECGLFRRDLIPRGISPELFGLWLNACDLAVNQKRVEFYEQMLEIVALAPEDAASHAALANGLLRMSAVPLRDASQQDLVAQARHSAREALRLEPEFAEALLALADAEPYGSWAKKEDLIRRAFRADPNFKWTRSQYLMFLHRVGRLKDAVHYAQRTTSLMRGPNHLSNEAWLLALTGRLDDAIAILDDVEATWPGDVLGIRKRFFAHAFFGDPQEAERLLEQSKLLRTIEKRGTFDCWRALLDYRLGKGALERAALHAACPVDENHLLPRVLAVMGDVDGALDALDELCGEWERLGHVDMSMNLFGPEMANVRRDPRFMRTAEGFGLATYWWSTGHAPDFCAAEQLPYDCAQQMQLAATAISSPAD